MVKLYALHGFLGLNTQPGGCNRSTPMTIEEKERRLFPLTEWQPDRQEFSNAMPSWYPHQRALHISNYSHVKGLLWHPIRRSPHPSRLNVVVFAPELPPFPPNHPDATHKQKEDPLNFMNGTWPREGQSLKAEDTDKKRKSWTEGLQGKKSEFLQISSHSSRVT